MPRRASRRRRGPQADSDGDQLLDPDEFFEFMSKIKDGKGGRVSTYAHAPGHKGTEKHSRGPSCSRVEERKKFDRSNSDEDFAKNLALEAKSLEDLMRIAFDDAEVEEKPKPAAADDPAALGMADLNLVPSGSVCAPPPVCAPPWRPAWRLGRIPPRKSEATLRGVETPRSAGRCARRRPSANRRPCRSRPGSRNLLTSSRGLRWTI